ncbi:hypothetical protein B0J13DRAFT_546994 [Dactylonectria estremocensis]|uniref:Uncharacterized protein n=1 Tax=Dactylonectria estremocensis TaxID=1079267 RepID=A0A9P9F427_9HYPO|nr:hypothetical protein B0J13DRAFT_546994 [Dactylonectria estremocensis]
MGRVCVCVVCQCGCVLLLHDVIGLLCPLSLFSSVLNSRCTPTSLPLSHPHSLSLSPIPSFSLPWPCTLLSIFPETS